MKRLVFIFLLCVLCVVAGCDPAAKFAVKETPAPAMNGVSSVHGTAVVASAAGSDVMIESAVFVVRYKERELVTARLMRPIGMPAGEVTRVRYDLALENTSLANLQTLQARLLGNPMQVTVDVKGYVRWGGLRKKVELESVPVMRIITNFAQ